MIATRETSPRSRVAAPRVRVPGVINAAEAYSVAEFRRRCGLGDYAWRQLRKELPLRRVGKKQFVLGSDWLAYLAGLGHDAKPDQNKELEG